LALQCRADDLKTRPILEQLNDPSTAACVEIEREVVRRLQGDCHSPIAALAVLNHGEYYLRVALGVKDGRPPVRKAEARGLSCSSVVSEALQYL
jgi:hydroxymethylbilane synthase